jgi:hypothetical protein
MPLPKKGIRREREKRRRGKCELKRRKENAIFKCKNNK